MLIVYHPDGTLERMNEYKNTFYHIIPGSNKSMIRIVTSYRYVYDFVYDPYSFCFVVHAGATIEELRQRRPYVNQFNRCRQRNTELRWNVIWVSTRFVDGDHAICWRVARLLGAVV